MSNSTEQEKQEYSSDNFAFFALAFVTCVALPYTLVLVRAHRRRAEAAARKAARAKFAIDPWSKERAEALAAANKWSLSDAVKWGFAAALWLAWLVAFVSVLTSAPAGDLAASGGFDPFKVLEISPSASDAEIKSAYKLMSRKWYVVAATRENTRQNLFFFFFPVDVERRHRGRLFFPGPISAATES